MHQVSWKGETYQGDMPAVEAWVASKVAQLGLTGSAFTSDPPRFTTIADVPAPLVTGTDGGGNGSHRTTADGGTASATGAPVDAGANGASAGRAERAHDASNGSAAGAPAMRGASAGATTGITGRAPIVSLAALGATGDGAEGAPTVTGGEGPERRFSDWGDGQQIVDQAARARIEAQHAALRAGGVAVDAGEQLYATGTRMAAGGYATQDGRKREHDAQGPIKLAGAALIGAVEGEGRTDHDMSAADFARQLTVNGKIAVAGFNLSEQAIRGLVVRLDQRNPQGVGFYSPMAGYVFGLRNRIADEFAKPEADRNVKGISEDRAKIAEILRFECLRAPEVRMRLRTRNAPHDIFAIVSQSYVAADAPTVVPQILAGLPADAKGSFAYNPATTRWELRASVWTATPVAEQAVGEAFRGYGTFGSRDDGGGSFTGGGGVELLRCLNASTYTAAGTNTNRRHMGAILADVDKMIVAARKAIDVLCNAWGTNRSAEIALPVPAAPAPRPMTIEQAIPGFWRSLLTAQQGELARLIPGKTETHVKALSDAYHAERRDPSKLVRADLAQGWTRYIQGQDGEVRRNAEAAIGSWLVSGSAVGYLPAPVTSAGKADTFRRQ
jgi:hypothetical protein